MAGGTGPHGSKGSRRLGRCSGNGGLETSNRLGPAAAVDWRTTDQLTMNNPRVCGFRMTSETTCRWNRQSMPPAGHQS